MIEILEPVSADDLADLRRAYLASQHAPVDGMWEAFAGMSRHREIRWDGERAGYCCVNDEGLILQFYLAAPHEPAAAEIFAAVAACDEAIGAMVSTADPRFLSLCLDVHQEVAVHTYLYRNHVQDEPAPAADAETSFDAVTAGELDAVAELQRDSLDQDLGDWLVGYLENLIARRELYALRRHREILATGEARVSDSQPPIADLGVITMRRHRGRGIATDVLRRLKRLCHDRKLVPICSTTVDNKAAQRAITRAGFVSRHRLLRVGF